VLDEYTKRYIISQSKGNQNMIFDHDFNPNIRLIDVFNQMTTIIHGLTNYHFEIERIAFKRDNGTYKFLAVTDIKENEDTNLLSFAIKKVGIEFIGKAVYTGEREFEELHSERSEEYNDWITDYLINFYVPQPDNELVEINTLITLHTFDHGYKSINRTFYFTNGYFHSFK